MLHCWLVLTRILGRFPARAARASQPFADAQEEHNYRTLLKNGAWFGLIDGGIYNFLPVYLARMDASPALVGMLTSGPSLIGILSYIPGGLFAERHSNMVKLAVRSGMVVRTIFLLIALLPFFLPMSALPLATVVVWSLMSIPNAVHISSWTSVIQKAVSAARRPQLNGTRWSLLSIVSGISIAFFGIMLDRSAFPIGFQVVFAISFLAGAVNMYYFSKVRVPPFVPERGKDGPSTGATGWLRTFVRPFADSPVFLRYNVASFIYRLAITMPVALVSIFWVKDLQASNTWIGLRGTAGYAGLVVGYRMWGHLAPRLGHRRLLLISGTAFAFYPMLTALAPSAPWLLPAAVLWGLSASGIDVGLFDVLLGTCPEGRQPTFIATANMLASIATFLGPLLGAALAAYLSAALPDSPHTTRLALLIIGGIELVSVASFVLLPSREQEQLDGCV
jgi:MFS family permease